MLETRDVSGSPDQIARAEQPKELQAELASLGFERIGYLKTGFVLDIGSGQVCELWSDSDSTTWAVPETGLFFQGLSMLDETVFLSSQLEDGSVIETSFSRHWWPTVFAPFPRRHRPRICYHQSRVRTKVLDELYQEHRSHLQRISSERSSPPRPSRRVDEFAQFSQHRWKINRKPLFTELLVGLLVTAGLWVSIVVLAFPDHWMPAAEGLPGLLGMAALYRLVMLLLHRLSR